MKRILVGLDSSARASAVLAAAVELGGKTGAKLVLLRAVGVPVELPVEAYRLSPASLSEVLQQEAERGLKELAKQAPAGMIEATRVGVGTPWQVVCDAAKELDADLILIGSHGFGMLDRVIGTTAARVVNHADRSVLVVRSKA
jgi:nucleotide-binding universal stress UspA family protein